jgi:MFS family permease
LGRDSVWAHRDLRLMLPARALSSFGDEMTLVVLTLRLFDQGFGPWSITGLLVCAALPVVVLAPLAGRLVDSMPFRTLAVATSIWQAACCAAIAFIEPLWSTYLLVVALQAGHVVAGPTWQALVPSIAGRDQVGRVVGTSQALNAVAIVAAPAAAGLAVGLFGYGVPLLIDAATFLVLGAAGLAIRTTRELAPARGSQAVGAPLALRSDALLWPLIAGLCALVVTVEITNVVEVFLLRGILDASSASFGLVAAVFAGGIVVGSVVVGGTLSDGSRARRVSVSAIVLALALTAAGLAPSLWVFAAAMAVVGVTNGMINADTSTVVLNRTPERSRGRALATVNAMVRGSSLGAMALGGAAGTLLGPRATFAGAGAVSVVVAILLLVRVRRALADIDVVPRTDGAPARVTSCGRVRAG